MQVKLEKSLGKMLDRSIRDKRSYHTGNEDEE
jgi:hypothetical protein